MFTNNMVLCNQLYSRFFNSTMCANETTLNQNVYIYNESDSQTSRHKIKLDGLKTKMRIKKHIIKRKKYLPLFCFLFFLFFLFFLLKRFSIYRMLNLVQSHIKWNTLLRNEDIYFFYSERLYWYSFKKFIKYV